MSNQTTDQKTYLELSEAGGGAHKYYEVTVSGSDVTIRYGRIGTPGSVSSTTYADAAKAQAAAKKKLSEKMRKGYASAVQGVRKPRKVTRRQMVSAPAPRQSSGSGSGSSARQTAVPSSRQAPVLWQFNSGSPAFGVFVDSERAWVGNERGDVYTLSHEGEVDAHFALPDGVKCIVADDFWIYAGCDDGKVYDLGGKTPHVAYEINDDVDIFWLDIHEAVLGVSDAGGKVTTIDHDDDGLWTQRSAGTQAWMVRCDDEGVYHGHSRGVTKYEASSGAEKWSVRTEGSVLFGWQEGGPDGEVYAATASNSVQRIGKADGAVRATYRCDGAVYACAASKDGEYIFAGDNRSAVYCFSAKTGERLWRLATGCGSAYSMQYHEERLYIVTTRGTLACIDAGEAAITAAKAGTVPQARAVKAPAGLAAATPSAQVATVSSAAAAAAGSGVTVECVRDGARLRMRVTSPGFDPSWRVQFPKDIREAGATYLVEEVRTAGNGSFYRARGEIRKVVA